MLKQFVLHASQSQLRTHLSKRLAYSAIQKMEQWVVKEPYLNLHCKLGEGPYYEKETNQLRFVDIKGKRLHAVDLTQGPESLKTTQFDIPVGYTANIEGVNPSDKIIVGGKKGVYMFDRKSENLRLLKAFTDDVQNEKQSGRLRSNDGAVDPWGKLWFGSQTDFDYEPPKAEGRFSPVHYSHY